MMKSVTCDDFEPLIHARLDAREPASPGLDEALASHAATCARCREIDQRYRALQRALDSWQPAPAPSRGLADRIVATHKAEQARRPVAATIIRPSLVPWWSAAAAVLAVVVGGLALRVGVDHAPPTGPPLAQGASAGAGASETHPALPPVANPLPEALAEATAATLELALETSLPAARVGRGVLASAALSREQFSIPPIESGTPPDGLNSQEDEGTTRVRPLSGTARNAFRFLLPPDLGG